VAAAHAACGKPAPAGHADGKPPEGLRDHALKMAECLRKQGAHANDPGPGEINVSVDEGPGDTPIAGPRWTIEEGFQTGKGPCGLDQHQVRTWTVWAGNDGGDATRHTPATGNTAAIHSETVKFTIYNWRIR
jgi:hypothetical protein